MFSCSNSRTALLALLAATACVASTPDVSTPARKRPAQVALPAEESPAPRPQRTEFALDDGTIASLVLSKGTAGVKRPGRSGLEFTVAGTPVVVVESTFSPQSSKEGGEIRGGQVLEAQRDREHSAFVVEARDGTGRKVHGFAPGLHCYATEVPAENVEVVFELCSSMRRVGDVLTYAQLPEVEETLIFGQPALDIAAGQFGGSRVVAGQGDVDCDGLLTAIDYGRHASQVETLTRAHGDVRVWWSVDQEGDEHGKSKVYAVRGEYCCGFEFRDWFEPASRSDLEALAHVCDNAAQPDWPNAYLPPPRPVGE